MLCKLFEKVLKPFPNVYFVETSGSSSGAPAHSCTCARVGSYIVRVRAVSLFCSMAGRSYQASAAVYTLSRIYIVLQRSAVITPPAVGAQHSRVPVASRASGASVSKRSTSHIPQVELQHSDRATASRHNFPESRELHQPAQMPDWHAPAKAQRLAICSHQLFRK